MKRNYQKSSSNSGSIEQDITAFFKSLQTGLGKEFVAQREKPSKGSIFCKGMVSVFRVEDLERRRENKEFKPVPLERYAFYPVNYGGSRIGSVAIYCDDAYKKSIMLRTRMSLFGRRIRQVRIEEGCRPFVDVVLAL